MQFGHSEGDSFIIDNPFKIENFYVNGNIMPILAI